MQRAPATAFALLICGALSLIAASSAHSAEPQPDSKNEITRQYSGKVVDPGRLEVRVLVAGFLSEVAVQDGQVVKEGDILFKLDRAALLAQLKAASAEARLVEKELDAANPVALQRLTAEQTFKLNAALGREYEAARDLNYTTVRAPFDGIVDQVREKAGSQVQRNSVLANMTSSGQLWVDFSMPDRDFHEWKKPRTQPEFEIAPANANDKPLLGKVTAITPDQNNQQGNVTFRVRFPNPQGLKPGQEVNVIMRTSDKSAAPVP